MNCPVCDERMREVEKNGVSLDICPGCKGVWLDRGELEKLIEAATSGGLSSDGRSANPGPARGYDKHDDHDEHHDRERHSGDERGYGERKKKGSWLGDVLGGFGGD